MEVRLDTAEAGLVFGMFGVKRAAIGVVHCGALPGTPHYDGSSVAAIRDQALSDAEAYIEGGLDGLIIENHGDIPFLKPGDMGPETSAAMAVITEAACRTFQVPTGVNLLANAPFHALAVAKAAGADFIRVNQWVNAYVANEGLIEGEAGKVLRYRSAIDAKDIRVFADVHVKHGAHAIVGDRPIEELARDAEFYDADVAIATGQRTGDAASLSEVETILQGTRLPVMIGSGVNLDNVESLLSVADGVIIGSSLKHDGVWTNRVDIDRVRPFAERVRAANQRAANG